MKPALTAGAFASALVPANDNQKWDGRRVLSWPTAARLLREDRKEELRLLWLWRTLSDLAMNSPANDNYPSPGVSNGEEDDRAADEAIEEVDSLMGFRPTIGEIKRAIDPTIWAGWLEDRRRCEIICQDTRANSNLSEPALRKAWAGLLFDGRNRLIGYRTSPAQKWHQQPAITRGARQHSNEMRGADVPAVGIFAIDEHILARQDFRQVRKAIGADHANVLELAIGPSTAKAIGETRRYVGKIAERWGIRMIDDALSALAEAWSP
ncbi:hypothetical protein [Devosia sp. SD17-2]|uniref:hypothetical protein n=1 Tax=Devosia sp. SD17-2 TaxID=2976459 RepID=UPI0023D86578|nr:hypothetical protein [Devosia sp. SD17-2]WEJ32185.1 hypothetical protein NYQ88_14920 [Devosia sp. SD17-2]